MLNIYQMGQLGRDLKRGNLSAEVLADSPYTYLKLDALSGTSPVDLGTGANTFTLNGSSRFVGWRGVFANTDRCIYFQGVDSYLTVGSQTTFRHTGNLTGMVCFSTETLPGTFACIWSVSITGETSGTNELGRIGIDSSGNITLFHENGAGVNNVVTFSAGIKVRTQYCVHWQRDTTAKTYELWINGVSLGTQSYTNNPDGGGTSVLNIGRDPQGSNFHWDGLLDEIAWWPSKLTSTRILAQYQALLG